MDHSNPEKEVYPQRHCPHGRCLDHGPVWENVEKRQEPSPGIFGQKTFWTKRCCGKPMVRYKEVQTRRCKKCGRTESHVTIPYLALCLCCGYYCEVSLIRAY